MSISELNQFMTYVIDGWLLFSVSSVGIGLVSFVSRRIQEDIEAENLAIAQTTEAPVSVTAAESATVQTASAVQVASPAPAAPSDKVQSDSNQVSDATEDTIKEERDEVANEAASCADSDALEEAARLEEVAAVSERLAKNKGKQSDTSSVSVST